MKVGQTLKCNPGCKIRNNLSAVYLEVSMKRNLLGPLVFALAFSSLAAAQEAAPQSIAVDKTQMASQMIKKVSPVYPPLARQARIQGQVVLKVEITKSGDVENIQLVSGHPMLAPSAIEAVKQWKYRPYLVNGEPVNVQTEVTVNFTLADASSASKVDANRIPVVVSSDTRDAAAAPAGVPANIPFPQRIRVSQGVEQGLLVTKIQPQYPPDAKDQHIQGVVLLSVTIDKQGNVANIQVVSGPDSLVPASIEAVKQWKYRPYLLQGIAVEVETQVTVNFTLEG
jgi:TonB family protein